MTLTESAQTLKNLCAALTMLKAAACPEDVFGWSGDIDEPKEQYRKLAKLVHPDGKKGKALAQATEAFKLLNEWHQQAQQKLANKTYGDRLAIVPVTLTVKKATYMLTRKLPGGDVANVYTGTGAHPYVFKVCRNPANNDLLDNEREILSYLWHDAPTKDLKAMAHIVKYHDSFELASGPARKRVNVYHLAAGYYNLAEVKAAFPLGIDMRDAAWMLNRLLGGILIIQQAGVVHNAILPEHVLIHPGKHNAKLCGWSYATKGKVKVSAVVGARLSYYAPEVLDKRPTSTASDIYMAAKTILSIVDKGTIPRNVMGVLKTCFLARNSRPQSAWDLFKEFGEELEKAFGPKKFRDFEVPVPSNAII